VKYITFLILFICQAIGYSSVVNHGIGGGGAMSGISFDPYKPGHLYIGTDMGLVYESFDQGKTWEAISQKKISFWVDLDHPSHMGFAPSGNLFWASGGCSPQMSNDRGKTWASMKELTAMLPEKCLDGTIRIKYWSFSDDEKNIIIVGTTSGLFISKDAGLTWTQFFKNQESLASLMMNKTTLVHATSAGIFKFDTQTSLSERLLNEPLSSAAIGQDQKGLTLVGVEKTTNSTKKMFIKKAGGEEFTQQKQSVGNFVSMVPKNSSIIYFTGNQSVGQGQAIWYSEDSGDKWSQRYTNDNAAYKDGTINPNPIGLYVGFWDDSYHDFQISPANPAVIASSGNFFFKLSSDAGLHWQFPYSELKNPTTTVSKESFWKTTQLNPVSAFFIKKNPANPMMIIAGFSDIGCVISQDNGESWRMCNIPQVNTIYDIAFNPKQPNQLYASASSLHDYPQDWHGDIQNDKPGGIYISDDAGINWRLLTPDTKDYNNPYLSIAIDFNQEPCHIYAGTQGKGIVASFNCGTDWQRLNEGFEPLESSTDSSAQKGSLIFPSIKISPKTNDIYALHTGNRLWQDEKNPFLHYTGLYKLDKATLTWKQLGRAPSVKAPGSGGIYWKYPIDFVVDWSNPQDLYLADMETAGTWKIGGLWHSSNEGKSWEQILQYDLPHKIVIKDNAIYLAGWGESVIYKSTNKLKFEPMNIDIPIAKVNDFFVDQDAFWFATFGGGIFKVDINK
jgi:photosystem II stability/assembly factor-like uncharacterized protein